MLVGLQLIHKLNPISGDADKIVSNGPVFQTCLRLIQVCWNSEDLIVPAGFDLLTGEKAYQFLLEIVCGLQSPVVGETEVFGQFKNFKNKQKWPHPLQVVLDNVIADTKKTRDLFLKDLGGQSYGSIVRKQLKNYTTVAFVGAGQFTQELLPWVYKEGKVITLFVRDVVKAQVLLEKYPQIKICDWATSEIVADVVLVTAPVTSSDLQSKISQAQLIMDLRGESRHDACSSFTNLISLEQIFHTIQSNQKQIHSAKTQALQEIEDLTTKRSLFEVLRPFGWDDICVW